MADLAPDILYIDNHLLVLNKPAGMPSQPDETGDQDILSWGKAYLKCTFDKPGNVFLGLVHRLDRPASGVTVFARTSKAAGRLSDQFRKRTVSKKYLAIVEENPPKEGRWTDYIVKRGREPRIVDAEIKGAQEARLSFRRERSVEDLTLVDINLETGRPHQIRLQFARRGFPLVGDVRYGSKRVLDGRNLALHCYRLEIEHPTLREFVSWSALPPATWPQEFRSWVCDM